MRRKKVQLNLRKVPEYIDIYIFGSYINSENPNDVDIIVVYDSQKYHGLSIFYECNYLIHQIEEELGIPVDVTYLSIFEEIETQFVDLVNAKSIYELFYIGKE